MKIRIKKANHSIAILAALILLSGCSSTTLIQSTPGKAKVYLDGKCVGDTPYRHRDSRIEGSSIPVRLEKEGYDPLYVTLTKDEKVNVGAVMGGLITIVPLLWSMEYLPVHSYALQPETKVKEVIPVIQNVQKNPWKKADRIREFKKLLDEKVITPEEFERAKTKVLEGK